MLRTLYPSDLDQLLTIENAVHVVPWTDTTFKACFQAGYVGWVVEIDKKIAGFIIISITIEECHILNLGVANEYQHQGWGRKLLQHALFHARDHGVGIAYLEVRRSNSRAIALYRKMKFHLVGERKDYYPTVSGHEDALIFAISLHDFK
ncbi:Mycothiol acetyltransferase [Aquicella siphonis]|uniref:[Ribosomal protein bS18]-alanine N-acetyltransferase n=1 Tax=Aquicella siphonis TaxID=254247 RepID=A0A5E4PE98_9COXI|nr:ribosomal protein S18-alanine N-acetyltransferase [Aquicella siphonis]VVC75280.1 Mycothiol acetyltransferase [Aquicella siphonis]